MVQYNILAAILSQVSPAEVHIGISWQSVILALIAAIPPTILAFAAWRQTKAVHTVVNSNATVAAQELKAARKEISDLRVYIAEGRPAVPDGPLPGKAELGP